MYTNMELRENDGTKPTTQGVLCGNRSKGMSPPWENQ
jgi:hypothetical protein